MSQAGDLATFAQTIHVCTCFALLSHLFKGREWLIRQMPLAAEPHLVYSTSSCNFHSAQAPERVFHTVPDARMLITVCDPVTRLVSEFAHNAAMGEWKSRLHLDLSH